MSDTQHVVKRREITVLNWMGTLILASIPVVNLIMFIIWAITSKRASKRNYAIASLILMLLCLALFVAGVAFFGDKIIAGLDWLQMQMSAVA